MPIVLDYGLVVLHSDYDCLHSGAVLPKNPSVVPPKAGTHRAKTPSERTESWTPAFAGVTS